MKLIYFLIAISIAFFGSIAAASADDDASTGDWVICPGCISSNQFIAAGAGHAPKHSGDFVYTVGNPNTGKTMLVTVIVTRRSGSGVGGTQVRRVRAADPNTISLNNGSVGFISPTDESDVLAGDESAGSLAASRKATSNAYNVTSRGSNAATINPMFKTATAVFKSTLVVSSPNTDYGFDSFTQSDPASFGPLLYDALNQAMSTYWTVGSPIPPKLKFLFNALKSFYGKGQIACIVFQNGDSGCYQINPLHPSAPLYVRGSAKDKDGREIPDSSASGEAVGSGGSCDLLTVTPNQPNRGNVTYSGPADRGDQYGIVCLLTQAGKTDSCYVTRAQ